MDKIIKTIDNTIKRFGHTLTLVCKEKDNEKAILFGGANGSSNHASMAIKTYAYYIIPKKWVELKSK